MKHLTSLLDIALVEPNPLAKQLLRSLPSPELKTMILDCALAGMISTEGRAPTKSDIRRGLALLDAQQAPAKGILP